MSDEQFKNREAKTTSEMAAYKSLRWLTEAVAESDCTLINTVTSVDMRSVFSIIQVTDALGLITGWFKLVINRLARDIIFP